MKVLIAGGGTGGHLMPALAIADAMCGLRPDVEPVLVGAQRGVEARILPERDRYRFHLLSVEPLHRRMWWRNAKWLFLFDGSCDNADASSMSNDPSWPWAPEGTPRVRCCGRPVSGGYRSDCKSKTRCPELRRACWRAEPAKFISSFRRRPRLCDPAPIPWCSNSGIPCRPPAKARIATRRVMRWAWPTTLRCVSSWEEAKARVV